MILLKERPGPVCRGVLDMVEQNTWGKKRLLKLFLEFSIVKSGCNPEATCRDRV